MTTYLRSEKESTEYVSVGYEAIAPRRRDFLRVLFGRYTPAVRRIERMTLAGADRALKNSWTGPAMAALAHNEWLLEPFEGRRASIPVQRSEPSTGSTPDPC